MKAKDIIDKHKTAESDYEMHFIQGGATYTGGRTAKLDAIIKDLEANGFRVGADCSHGESGTAIIYIWKI